MNTPIDRKYDIIHTVSLNDNLYSNKPYAAEKVSERPLFSHRFLHRILIAKVSSCPYIRPPPEDKHPETTTNQRTLARLRL